MKGDFARVTFDPTLHYSQVLQQQGRVLLEADWNEQASIQLHLLRTMVRDLVGPCWAVGQGFTIATQPHVTDWQLSAGHFYADGILCVNDAMSTLSTQPYAPTPDDTVYGGNLVDPPDSFALWLDVWERHLCAVEAPEISDTALNGVDTASRVQVVWQARMLALDASHEGAPLDDATAALNVRLQAATNATDQALINQQIAAIAQLRNNLGTPTAANGINIDPCTTLRQIFGARATYAWPAMSAQLGPVESDSDPCIIAADARYRGCENQLYRVEVHQGGLASTTTLAAASIKWSREDGSVVFPILSAPSTAQSDGSTQIAVTLANLGRDQRLSLAVNDWVELVDDDYTLAQRALPLLQVIAIDVADRIVTLTVPKNITAYAINTAAQNHPLLRRWDQSVAVNAQGTVALVEGAVIDLEDGIQISFVPGGLYATGDYWLIPARVAGNGTLDWPQVAGAAAALKSRGMHHYAVLGVSNPNGGFTECCCRFDSLCALIRQNAKQTGATSNTSVLQPLAPAVKTAAAATNATKTAPAVRKTEATAKTVPPAKKATKTAKAAPVAKKAAKTTKGGKGGS
ncbi:DUF6519 domain-containing protein [Rhodanobacter sp. MP7CTX1]|uniref:DUF6519 domain-containing protein n=1 Tax=Rhodanobacter sp. MP7CTX1 TaxID=2723084 RepID=UPI00161ED997|nr:DUF6519 domain-containing protein [Rhodanobacter sp. MP7CTX1]MBB6187837.1 hypothetical protein [Rhodanobacter sp. MP7CTX1]